MRTAAVVPVKDFARAKKRLRARFDDRAVERILRALLADVLAALGEAKRIERVFVLTDDAAVAEAARASGADVSCAAALSGPKRAGMTSGGRRKSRAVPPSEAGAITTGERSPSATTASTSAAVRSGRSPSATSSAS